MFFTEPVKSVFTSLKLTLEESVGQTPHSSSPLFQSLLFSFHLSPLMFNSSRSLFDPGHWGEYTYWQPVPGSLSAKYRSFIFQWLNVSIQYAIHFPHMLLCSFLAFVVTQRIRHLRKTNTTVWLLFLYTVSAGIVCIWLIWSWLEFN